MTWPRSKLKFVARFSYGDALPTDESQDGPYRVFGSNGPFASFSRANTGAPAIVIGRKGSYGKVNWTQEPCFASDTTFFVDGSTSRNHLRWVYWLLQTLQLDEGTDEAAVPGLNRETAYSRDVFVPPLPQQRAIADHLDRETARLDALAAAKGRMLGVLAEKRRALITRAVTGGLDPRAPLRDSGIPWLGAIPAHWEATQLKRVAAVIDCKHRTVPFVDDGVPLASIREVQSWEVDLAAAKMTTDDEYLVMIEGDRDPRPGDVIVSRNATVGAAALVPEGVRFCMGQDVSLVRSKDMLEPSFLNWLFRSDALVNQIVTASIGSTFFRINVEQIKALVIPLPGREEQHEIVAYLATAASKFEAVRAATEQTIALLKERRAALVAAAVTGRLEVM